MAIGREQFQVLPYLDIKLEVLDVSSIRKGDVVMCALCGLENHTVIKDVNPRQVVTMDCFKQIPLPPTLAHELFMEKMIHIENNELITTILDHIVTRNRRAHEKYLFCHWCGAALGDKGIYIKRQEHNDYTKRMTK